ncbi:DUF1697 domain-containing protein [Mycetocola tolaasinivorans]|uniref:DUF1697 domain-containing protein n=1 Tax=Mycetocola tolaasinivorans TaxID=76635 RepID=A0A3L6ZW57_9MICO|nr:DUF1697 domain-containing protein [Mycetocola tolaasinivorans]RLP72236.1 DUF1697 domain-containing protein [Mycetocola tolaasinivorans]
MTAQRVALLRGINVGGVRITSGDLAAVFTSLGLTEVSTVLATGSVCFSGGITAAELEAALSARFDYAARVIIVEVSDLAEMAARVPLAEDPERHRYLVFADPGPDQAAVWETLAGWNTEGDDRVVRDTNAGALWWSVPRGASTTTPFAKAVARAGTRGLNVTTRNIGTVQKILARAS